MFNRKDVMPILFLLGLIATLMLTLSQILVVHHHYHPTDKQTRRDIRHLTREIDGAMKFAFGAESPPLNMFERSLMAQIYAERVQAILLKAKHSAKDLKYDTSKYDFDTERRTRILQNLEQDYVNKRIDENIYYIKSKQIGISSTKTNKAERYLANKVTKTTQQKFNLIRFINRTDCENNTNCIQTNGTLVGRRPDVLLDNQANTQRHTMTPCPGVPDDLVGPLQISFKIDPVAKLDRRHENMKPGGVWYPRDCVARHRVAIIVPYRQRKKHLQYLLFYLIPLLQRQQLDFRIFVVEQAGNELFNKGVIMNAGFTEALKLGDFQCFVFHDVDLIPEDDRNMYSCPKLPRHMSPAVDKFMYKLPYSGLVGGVLNVGRDHFVQLNGFSNLYVGWGGEDDDMALRLMATKLNIFRPPSIVGRYKMIKHRQSNYTEYKRRTYLLKTAKHRYREDGLNSVKYKLNFINNMKLYTHIMVNIDE